MPVYIIRAGENGPVKIGFTSNMPSRLAYLKAAHYEELRVLRVLDLGIGAEGWMHRRFAHAHIRGEWFHFLPEMLTVQPERYSHIDSFPEAFQRKRAALVAALNDRPDLTYGEIADHLGIKRTMIGNWIAALQAAGEARHRHRRTRAAV